MLFRDAGDNALSAAPARTLTHRLSWLVAFRCRGVCVKRLLGVRRSPRRAPPQLGRLNVLIHPEEIIGIVFFLDRDQPLVIAAVGFLYASFSFVAHQEVYVGSPR